MDPSGNLWVPDFGGNRVLEFKPPFAFEEAATVVLGQPDNTTSSAATTATGLNHPGACATDAHGDVWVSDYFNSRVLEYIPPFSNGMPASHVLGQALFTTGASGTSPTALSAPVGLRFDTQGNLWVADDANNRVVEYLPPFSNGMAASIVIGQTSFTGNFGGRTAMNLSAPLDVAVSGGILWVADHANARVLGFSAPFATGEGATYLLGQSSFTGTGAIGPGSFLSTDSVAVDSLGNLWVSDFNGNRVVEFLPPFTVFENASVAIGQTSLTSTTAGTSATTLTSPLGAFVAPSGALWVTDATNHRVLEYVPNVYHINFHSAGLPNGKAWSVVVGGVTLAGTGPNATVPEENGSYAWSVPTIPGYSVAPRSGNVNVSGGNVTVSLTMTQVTYSVTFNALGLPSTSNWSVTFGGVTHKSVSNGSISFTEANGTFAFVVANVSGYNITPLRGSVQVNGSGHDVAVGFAALSSSSSSGSSSPFSTTVTYLLIVVAAVVGLLVGLLLGRRRKGGASAPAAPWAPPPAGPGNVPPPPPPGAGGPPPGASG